MRKKFVLQFVLEQYAAALPKVELKWALNGLHLRYQPTIYKN